MSPIGTPAASAADIVRERRVCLRPTWLRPLLIVLVVAAHAGAFASFDWFTADKIARLDDIEVDIVAQGETVTETSSVPTPEAAPVVTSDQAVLASPDPEMDADPNMARPNARSERTAAPPEIMAPPPKIEVEDAPPIAIEQRQVQEPAKPVANIALPSPRAKNDAKRRSALRAPTRAKAEMHARQQAAQAQLGAPAIRAGARDGSSQAARISESSYGALVSAEINRHKIYPAAARSEGAAGTVDVVFTVDSSGAIVSHTITRSSGNAAIDAAVHAMMSAARPPPPPNGQFRGSVVIRFNLGR